jgi:3',5'-cyclic AMP phosphodiesterase CpdA
VLTIAQISDLHITDARGGENMARNDARLRQVLEAVHALKPRPVALILSGDLVDNGAPEEYRRLEQLLSDCEIPIHMAVGNHDGRQAFLDAFEGPRAQRDADGFVQYAVDFDGLRLVVGDTLEEGREGGAYCERRAAWLNWTLDEAPATPTLLVLHHPPVASGIQWMDPEPQEEWIIRLAGVLRGRSQIQTVACGHLHRAFHRSFAGQVVSVAPASSIELTLNLTPIDLRHPDGRELLNEEPPGFALHMWDGQGLTSHVCVAGHYAAAAAYTVPFVKS